MKRALLLAAVLMCGTLASAQLFVGLESSPPIATRTTDLAGFPNVSWVDRFDFDVNGAAAAPEGVLYICNGPFTTRIHRSVDLAPPQQISTATVDLHGLAFGKGKLYGFANFANPIGIYEVDPNSGQCTLRVSTVQPGFRFFGLDYNPADGLLYGYTEYGDSGLYSIDVGSGTMTKVAGPIPASNTQGRALACGNNTVYLASTRGDDGVPCFAYDLAQGPRGVWVPFTQAYPDYHSTGGAAFLRPRVPGDLNCDGVVNFGDINPFVVALSDPEGYRQQYPDCAIGHGDINRDGQVDFGDINPFVELLSR